MIPRLTESDLEATVLEHLQDLGWDTASGDAIAPGNQERDSWSDLHIRPRMLEAMIRLNPGVPTQYIKQALSEILTPTSQEPRTENHRIHKILTDGYRLSYYDQDGTERNTTLRLIGTHPHQNDWLAAQQVRLAQKDRERRFDVVLYCNGMPVSVIELKKPGVGFEPGFDQLGTYLRDFPVEFRFTVLTLTSDGYTARYGTPFTPLNHFSPWNVDDFGERISEAAADAANPPPIAVETAVSGLYAQERFLQLVSLFTAFDSTDQGLVKRIAKPHQYFAVTKAVQKTMQAVNSDGRAGIVWHTQGSGKSMEMELYASAVLKESQLRNPTIVVVTDRTELDGQLFSAFDRSDLLPERPRQVLKRAELRSELSNRLTGGIYFTTLQKFNRTLAERREGLNHPTLTERNNVLVIVDEAHRSHYDSLDGYARHLRDALPHATLIAFTGTPISTADRNTREVFGDYIDIYDLSRAVEDGATVPVYFEPRLIDVNLSEEFAEEELDTAADEATTGLDLAEKTRLQQSVAVINAIYGAPERIQELAADLVDHWEQRRAHMEQFIEGPGKAMIVGATRQICAQLYAAITELRPQWHAADDKAGQIKVVYSGDATDQPPVSDHVRRPSQTDTIKNRLKDPEDELELVIVKDMMLTGFDAPALHTLYLDRPLKGALLMQTLARVNRTFRGKEDGLLVGYAPLSDNLANALKEYSQDDQETRPVGKDDAEAARLLGLAVDMIDQLFGTEYDWRSHLASGTPRAFWRAVQGAVNFLRNPQRDPDPDADEPSPAEEFRSHAATMARLWTIAARNDAAAQLKVSVQFYQEVRVLMAKMDAEERRASGQPVPEDVQRLLRRLIDKSTHASDQPIDIYQTVGIERPALSDLSPEMLGKLQESPSPHLVIEDLRNKLLEEVRSSTSHNTIRERAFSQRIQDLMYKYKNQQLTAAEVMARVAEIIKEAREEGKRGERFDPPLGEDELAFYDALAHNQSAQELQGDTKLAEIARDLVKAMRQDSRTDWTVREEVRAKLRATIRRLLTIHGYPPDKQASATKLVIDQMDATAQRWGSEP